MQTLFSENIFNNGNFNNFFEQESKRIRRFSKHLCGENDSEDAFQETLIVAYQNLPRKNFENERALQSWLFRVVKNSCLMKRRRSKFAPLTFLSLESPFAFEESNSLEIADSSGRPDKKLMQNELKTALGEAIESLPEEQKAVFQLRELEGKSTQETAALLGISQPNVKTTLHRAKNKLQHKLAAFYR